VFVFLITRPPHSPSRVPPGGDSQDTAELLQLPQGLLAPAASPRGGGRGRAAGARASSVLAGAPPVLLRGPRPRLALLAHVHRERPAVELQHPLLEDGGRREQEPGPDDGEGSVPQGAAPGARQATAALLLPPAQRLQASCRETVGGVTLC